MHDDNLRTLLTTLSPKARTDLRRVLIRDQADRDEISSGLMCYRDQNGQDWADIIDFLTMRPEARRGVVRLLGELETITECGSARIVGYDFPIIERGGRAICARPRTSR
jgi:hypothetical protein